MITTFGLESLKRKRHSEDLSVDGKVVLKWILYEQTVWIGFVCLRGGTVGCCEPFIWSS
jgi:hypothetical protein